MIALERPKDDIPIVHDIDYNDADYIDDLQNKIQGQSRRIFHNHPKSFGDAFEKLVANNDDLLWHSFFGK